MADVDVVEGILARIRKHEPPAWSPTGAKRLNGILTSGVAVLGEMRRPVEGERYRFYGRRKVHPIYGDQILFDSYEVIIDDSEVGVARYLELHVAGVGRAKAAMIVDHFGAETLPVLRADPERVAEVPGLRPALIESIRHHFREEIRFDPVAYAKLIDLFAGFRIPRSVVHALLDYWSSDAPLFVAENPYRLLQFPRIGWETADKFALARIGYEPGGIERHRAALLESFERIARDGHTWATRLDVDCTLCHGGLLGSFASEEAWAAVIREGEIVEIADGSGRPAGGFGLAKFLRGEWSIAERLRDLADDAMPLPRIDDPRGLAAEQIAAIRLIEREGVAILAGPPGTGKSTTLAALVSGLLRIGYRRIVGAAPTGKAAKRAAELLARAGISDVQVPFTTIHKMLCPGPLDSPEDVPEEVAKFGRGRGRFGFQRNRGNPIPADLIIIDESSMVDVPLMASLLEAVEEGTRILFVGDQHQLPPVGPGAPFRDMIDAGIPAAYLTEIRRSDGGGRIVRACHAILRGEMPEPSPDWPPRLPTENWFHREAQEPEQIAAFILEFHEAGARFPDLLWDFQVVSPQKRTPYIGCEDLNRWLSSRINPPRPEEAAQMRRAEEDGHPPPPFRVGDKVIRTKNEAVDQLVLIREDEEPGAHEDYEWEGRPYRVRSTYVVNGDMGIVRAIIPRDRGSDVLVELREEAGGGGPIGKLIRLPYDGCHLLPAYAMTAHKCQGSGFPLVIVPVHGSFYWNARENKGLFSREWIYTAVSRAEILLITVGQFAAIRSAVSRKTVDHRRTRLPHFLRLPDGIRMADSIRIRAAKGRPAIGGPAPLAVIGDRPQRLMLPVP